MNAGKSYGLLNVIRKLAARAQPAGVSDAQLLERYCKQRDQGAFELLVHRHGPMVLGACRRVLQDEHRTEDAFQAAFVVLARHAGRLGSRECVGGWLYTVAVRIALRARQMQAARTGRERPMDDSPETSRPHDDAENRELKQVIDEEVSRLPARQQRPFVLCYMEAKSHEEVARELGVTAHQVRARLQRARLRLQRRLARRGFTVGAATVTAVLSAKTAHAAVPPALVAAALQAAAVAAGQVLTGVVGGSVLTLANGTGASTASSKIVIAALALAGVSIATAGGAIGFGWCGKATANLGSKSAAQTAASDLATQRAADTRTPRQRLLEESCLPRVIADFESIGGKATVVSAHVDDDRAEIVLDWAINPLSAAPVRVRMRYQLQDDGYFMWRRDDKDGEFKEIDPLKPIYTELWPGGPKMAIGKAQAEDMKQAFAVLKD